MSSAKHRPMDPESILATLESLSQAIDAMTAVVGELRGMLDQHPEFHELPSVILEPEELELVDRVLGERTVH